MSEEGTTSLRAYIGIKCITGGYLAKKNQSASPYPATLLDVVLDFLFRTKSLLIYSIPLDNFVCATLPVSLSDFLVLDRNLLE